MNAHSSSTSKLQKQHPYAAFFNSIGRIKIIMTQLSQLADTLFGPIEYRLVGTGQQICVLLHGGHSNCFEELGTQEILRTGLTALIPSRPGYGKTPAHVGNTAEESAEAIIALLDSLAIQSVSVVAVSAGGPTGLYLASRYPERINKLVLESAVTKRWLKLSDPLYKIAKIIFGRNMQHLTWAMTRLFVRISPNLIFRQMIPSFTTLKPKDVLTSLSAQDKAAFKNMLMRSSSGSGFMLDLEHRVPTEILAKIKTPTLIVHSKNDHSVLFEHAEHAQRTIQQAELYEAQTWGHLIWLGDGSQAVFEKVSHFLHGGIHNRP